MYQKFLKELYTSKWNNVSCAKLSNYITGFQKLLLALSFINLRNWKNALDKIESVCGLFMDLSNVFNTSYQDLLLANLKAYDFSKKIHCLWSLVTSKTVNKKSWSTVAQAQRKQLLKKLCKVSDRPLLIAAALSPYSDVWVTFLKKSVKLDIGGDHTQHILWWVKCLLVPSYPIILVRIVPVKLLIEFYAFSSYSRKKSLSQNNYYQDFLKR